MSLEGFCQGTPAPSDHLAHAQEIAKMAYVAAAFGWQANEPAVDGENVSVFAVNPEDSERLLVEGSEPFIEGILISENQVNSSGILFSCSERDQLAGLCSFSCHGAPPSTHAFLKRRTPFFVASWYPCSTPQQGQNSNSGVAPSSPQGGLSSQYPQTLQLCTLLSIEKTKFAICVPYRHNDGIVLLPARSSRKKNHVDHGPVPDLPPRGWRDNDSAPSSIHPKRQLAAENVGRSRRRLLRGKARGGFPRARRDGLPCPESS